MPSNSKGYNCYPKRARMDNEHVLEECASVPVGQLVQSDHDQNDICQHGQADEQLNVEELGALPAGNALNVVEGFYDVDVGDALPGDGKIGAAPVQAFDIDDRDEEGVDVDWDGLINDPFNDSSSSEDLGFEGDSDGSSDIDEANKQNASEAQLDQGYEDSLDSGDELDGNDDFDNEGHLEGGIDDTSSEDDSDEELVDGAASYAEWAALPLFEGAQVTCRQTAMLLANLVQRQADMRRALRSLLRLLNQLLPPGHRMVRTRRQLWTLARI